MNEPDPKKIEVAAKSIFPDLSDKWLDIIKLVLLCVSIYLGNKAVNTSNDNSTAIHETKDISAKTIQTLANTTADPVAVKTAQAVTQPAN